MSSPENPAIAAPPARRRIIPQPLRTEAPIALIAADAKRVSELEARLKGAHPLITFPSFSHFLAEPARREPWEAIVVARDGAWDPRLDGYVRRRSCIALFGLAEESFGWPEAVARLGELAELEPWLAALRAPAPVLTRKLAARSATRGGDGEKASAPRPRVSHSRALLGTLGVKPSAQASKATQLELPATLVGQGARAASALSPRAQRTASEAPAAKTPEPSAHENAIEEKPAKPSSLRGAQVSGQGRRNSAPPARPTPTQDGKRRAPPAPVPQARKAASARPTAALPAHESEGRRANRYGNSASVELALTQSAAELGLRRAYELLDELRARAAGLAARMSRDLE